MSPLAFYIFSFSLNGIFEISCHRFLSSYEGQGLQTYLVYRWSITNYILYCVKDNELAHFYFSFFFLFLSKCMNFNVTDFSVTLQAWYIQVKYDQLYRVNRNKLPRSCSFLLLSKMIYMYMFFVVVILQVRIYKLCILVMYDQLCCGKGKQMFWCKIMVPFTLAAQQEYRSVQ